MSSREIILAAVRANHPLPAPALPAVPLFERGAAPLLAQVRETLERMGGKSIEAKQGENLDALICSLFPQAQVISSAAAEVKGTRGLNGTRDPADLADVDVGVARAAFGVAETGSLWLSETELQINSLAFLAQHFVALLDPRAIVPNLHHAYRDSRFATARYAVLVTGPSATADIEGVLIHGAQGVRSLTVVLVPTS